MAKKRKQQPAPTNQSSDKPATLKDLLSADMLSKLKAQSEDLKAAEAERKEVERKQAEEARKAEQKKLDNDFEYLLNNNKMDWRNYKS